MDRPHDEDLQPVRRWSRNRAAAIVVALVLATGALVGVKLAHPSSSAISGSPAPRHSGTAAVPLKGGANFVFGLGNGYSEQTTLGEVRFESTLINSSSATLQLSGPVTIRDADGHLVPRTRALLTATSYVTSAGQLPDRLTAVGPHGRVGLLVVASINCTEPRAATDLAQRLRKIVIPLRGYRSPAVVGFRRVFDGPGFARSACPHGEG